MKSLAVKYRPTAWNDVVEQDVIKTILKNQIETKTIKNAYLFVGGAGTGKTTCARIFANEINNHNGTPIELDAASNSSVDDVREIIQQAKLHSLDSEYKVFILDECHVFSLTAWQAFLKLLEEPPEFSIFIFCTTNPEKIPKTILSRVQRYDFQNITTKGIYNNLVNIVNDERVENYEESALNYISKLADGGMRNAITLLDKCLSYSNELTLHNVSKVLDLLDYELLLDFTDDIFSKKIRNIVDIIEDINAQGIDLKQFIKQYLNLILDINKYAYNCPIELLNIPDVYIHQYLEDYGDPEFDICADLLKMLIKLNYNLKNETSPKMIIIAEFLLFCLNE